MILEWVNALVAACGVLAGIGGTMLFKSGRDKARAEADKAIKDNYEERIADLHKSVEALNETEVRQAKRIAELNAALDNKTVRIREVEDRLVVTERENTRLAEEAGELKKELAEKRCHLLDCTEREPPTGRTRRARKKAASATTAKEDTETIKDPDNE